MRVLNVLSGRVIWLFETIELNPRGLDVHPVYFALKNRYTFSTPNNREDFENPKDGIKFEQGRFKPDGSDSFAVRMTLYSDGIVAETAASTGHSEAFLEDAAKFIQTCGLHFDPSVVTRKRYNSSLLIESEVGLSKISESLEPISARIGSITGRNFRTSGLTISFDPTEPNDGFSAFTIERRTGVSFSTNRFFSAAPLKTEEHTAILEQLEKLMA